MPLSARCGLRAQLWFKGILRGDLRCHYNFYIFSPSYFVFYSSIGPGTFFVSIILIMFVVHGTVHFDQHYAMMAASVSLSLSVCWGILVNTLAQGQYKRFNCRNTTGSH